MGPDLYLYVGDAEEIPDENMGFLLPGRRKWAQKYCRFVKPIVGFDPGAIQGKRALRKKLNLPEDNILFFATIGPEGKYEQRITIIEQVFENLKSDFPDAYFIITCPEAGTKKWIHYHQFLDNLYQYFAVSDFVITQSGYGKVTELSALGVPFIAIPLDYHFEQEYVMGHRLDRYGIGKLVTMRDHNPQDIAKIVHQLLNVEMLPVEVDQGMELANIILSYE
jgi:UDP:flavonoid glycosyltransferase YjiC (YdhE family)